MRSLHVVVSSAPGARVTACTASGCGVQSSSPCGTAGDLLTSSRESSRKTSWSGKAPVLLMVAVTVSWSPARWALPTLVRWTCRAVISPALASHVPGSTNTIPSMIQHTYPCHLGIPTIMGFFALARRERGEAPTSIQEASSGEGDQHQQSVHLDEQFLFVDDHAIQGIHHVGEGVHEVVGASEPITSQGRTEEGRSGYASIRHQGQQDAIAKRVGP